MEKKGSCWLHVKTRAWRKWRRFSATLAIVFLLMCLLRIQINSGGLYYAVETAQNTSITVDEVLEEATQNWRGLRQKDVSFSMYVAHLPCFIRATYLPWENSQTMTKVSLVTIKILPMFRRNLLHPPSV